MGFKKFSLKIITKKIGVHAVDTEKRDPIKEAKKGGPVEAIKKRGPIKDTEKRGPIKDTKKGGPIDDRHLRSYFIASSNSTRCKSYKVDAFLFQITKVDVNNIAT